MAFVSFGSGHTGAGEAPRGRVAAALRAAWRAVVRGTESLQHVSTGYRCSLEAARLNELSDEELAAYGLKRDEIVHHAFRRYMHPL